MSTKSLLAVVVAIVPRVGRDTFTRLVEARVGLMFGS
jgi:hypothetical protein